MFTQIVVVDADAGAETSPIRTAPRKITEMDR
jgi:hypothetical protein